jgi:hypothetical protein
MGVNNHIIIEAPGRRERVGWARGGGMSRMGKARLASYSKLIVSYDGPSKGRCQGRSARLYRDAESPRTATDLATL